MCLTKKKYFIFFYVSSCVIVNRSEAQICHKLSTLEKPTSDLLCNGFEDILNFDIETDEDVGNIDLSKNNITSINEASFTKNLNNIIRVFLDNNSITTIGSNAFKLLPNLEVLDLSHNNITFIDPEAFTSNRKLKIIDLGGNQLQKLDKRTINRLDTLEELTLSGNPIKVCSRKTIDALNLLEERRVKTYFLDSCEGSIVEDDYDFITEPISTSYSKKRLLIFAILGVLSLLAIVMTIVVSILCVKIFNRKKFNSSGPRRHRTLSDRPLLNPERLSTLSQDRNGYLIPQKSKIGPQYLEVIGDAPLIPKESAYSNTALSTSLVPHMDSNRQSEYSVIHHYEIIKEESPYERNILVFH
ncbi:hypothetical protein ILUMI_13501 [Ignelater luminosus]|uniref:Uncharacterized protein n=1 Tax=Ignelater luminosus TaxID=2038154 RepID=A0A8K0CSB2_IGNLU|nr:hypothetical protein ILUMI_13501 [Ignelater luminosus]